MLSINRLYTMSCVLLDNVNMHTENSLGSPSQKKHQENGTEQNGECTNSGNDNLSDHLHVARQRICEAHTVTHI